MRHLLWKVRVLCTCRPTEGAPMWDFYVGGMGADPFESQGPPILLHGRWCLGRVVRHLPAKP